MVNRGSIKIWKGNVMSEDNHTEMNSEVFGNWFNQEVEKPESEEEQENEMKKIIKNSK